MSDLMSSMCELLFVLFVMLCAAVLLVLLVVVAGKCVCSAVLIVDCAVLLRSGHGTFSLLNLCNKQIMLVAHSMKQIRKCALYLRLDTVYQTVHLHILEPRHALKNS